MPPHGLYPIPRHHLYDAYKPRPSFNTMDFEDDDDSQKGTVLRPSAQNVDMSEVPHEGEVKERKQRKRKKYSQIENETSGAPAATSAQISVGPNSKSKRNLGEMKGKEETTHVPRSGPKKQKRERVSKGDKPVLAHTTCVDGFVIGGDMLQSLETSMSNIGQSFRYLTSAQNDSLGLQENTKKSRKKKYAVAVPSVPLQQKTEDQEAKKQGRKGNAAVQNQSKVSRTLTASPVVNRPHARGSRRSNVPLPPPRRMSSFAVSKKTEQKPQESIQDLEAIVFPDTPQTTKAKGPQRGRGSTPFLKSSFSDALRAAIQSSQEQPATPILSSLSSDSDSDTQTSLLALVKPQGESRKTANQYGLSPVTLERMLNIQPLADKPKSRLHSGHTSGANSAITSFPSSGSSTNLPITFDRVGMPYARSGAAIDPFIQPETKSKKKWHETQEEAMAVVFSSKFSAVQKTVNFSDEQDYLDEYLYSNANNNFIVPLPCLGKITGCTAKKEQILRAGKEKDETVARIQVVGRSNPDVINDVNMRTHRVEEFLVTAIKSRVPVPVGRLAGTWKLFSPKYSENHFDRYGLGSRTLTIHTVAGSEDQGIFTARLNIPPRSTAFVISPFMAPPHASFRITTLKAIPENYNVDVVFLGNGYLQLRLDLNLLLRGKPAEMVEGKKTYMEFLGVHEKALQWVDKKNELEEEGKKLFAKYGGGDDE